METSRRALLCACFLTVCFGLNLLSFPSYADNAQPNNTQPAAQLPKTRINPKDGAEMILIPAGEFPMGDIRPGKPQHIITLDDYYIYKNDVTVAQYRKFCVATGRQMPGAPSFGWHDDHPMIIISWDDANAYAQWVGAVLPTEAQWEKAARGTDGRLYPWGNDWDETKCHCSKVIGGDAKQTAPVGSFPTGASPYGILDMAGNVAQWCADWYDENYFQNAPAHNPSGPTDGKARAVRGSTWIDCATRNWSMLTTSRGQNDPTKPSGRIGFRCVVIPGKDVQPPTSGGSIETVDTTAKLQITTEPTGAMVYLDGVQQDQTTNCTLSLPLGIAKTKTVELGLTLAGYEDEVRKVTLERGKVTSGIVTMRRKPASVIPVPTPPTDVPAKVTDWATEDFSAPINVSKDEMNARLKSAKDSLFFLDSDTHFGRAKVEIDSFLLPNMQYAKMSFTWTKLLSVDGANLLRQPTAKELQASNPHDPRIYSTDDMVDLDSATGSVQLQIPIKFAHITFAAADINATRQDTPLTATLVSCKEDTCSLKLEGKFNPDDVIIILRDAAGKQLTMEDAGSSQDNDGSISVEQTVSGRIAKIEVFIPTEYAVNTLDIVATASPKTVGVKNINVKVMRFLPNMPTVKGTEYNLDTLKTQVSIAPQREEYGERNTPMLVVKLPSTLNSAYAAVDFGKPQLLDANGKAVIYEPEESGLDIESFTHEFRFTQLKKTFSFATGTVHLRYPAQLKIVTLTPGQPVNGDVQARFDGAKVKIVAKDCPDNDFLPENFACVRAFDASGHQLKQLNYGGSETIDNVEWTEYAFWGKPAEVHIVIVEKWLPLDLPYRLPPAPRLPDVK